MDAAGRRPTAQGAGVVSTQYRVPSTEYPVPSTQYAVRSAKYPHAECGVPTSCLLSTGYWVLGTAYSSLASHSIGAELRWELPVRRGLELGLGRLLRMGLQVLQQPPHALAHVQLL